MNIALTCPASLPATQFGGIMFLCLNIAKILSKGDNKITIYTTDLDFANNSHTFNKNLPKEEKIENFTIKRTHVWFSFFLYYINPKMYSQMKHDNIDIIHTIGIRSFQAFVSALISKRKKIPLFISDQGGLTTHPDLSNSSLFKRLLIWIQKPLIKFIIRQATQVIVPNDYEKNIFLQFCESKKISVVPNGIDLDEFENISNNFCSKYKINKKFILFLGRFHHVKGIDTLLQSIYELKNKKTFENILFVIMGVDFGYQSKMENSIKKLQLEKNIQVISKPSRDDVISAYYQSLFLVLPSKWELSPLTPLEAFACKKTVISTTAHGIPYTIKNMENCILVPPNDSLSLSKAIFDLVIKPEKCEQFGENGYNYVHSIANSKKMVENFFNIYSQHLQSK